MKKNRFNEPERFLMQRWADVETLRNVIKSIDEKYKAICSEVCDAVQKKQPELDYRIIRPDYDNDRGTIGIGKKNWPRMYDKWPSGFYISEFGLKNLTSEEEEHPYACIWLKPPIKLGFDLTTAGKTVSREARRLMTPVQFKACRFMEDDWACLWYPLQETRQHLLEMLLSDQVDEFVKCLVSHFEVLAKLTLVIDDLFQTKKKRTSS